MKIAILLGSARSGRQSHKVANYLQQVLNAKGVETDLIDLAMDALPVMDHKSGSRKEFSDAIKDIGSRLDNADALLFVTPEYHGSFSGVLKNALDYYWSEFSKKPIGVAAVSAGRMGGINASTQLQHVILSLGAYPLPLKLLVPEVSQAFSDNFKPTNDRIINAANKFIDEFLWFSDAISQKKSQEQLI